MVRLKLDDVKRLRKPKAPPKKPKKKNRDDSDFDSEVEYGSENAGNSDSESDCKMDDGTTKLEDEELLSVSDEHSSGDGEEEQPFDPYVSDTFLVRREATLLTLVRRGFHKRVIVFFNEKKQCQRAHILFAIFGLKAA